MVRGMEMRQLHTYVMEAAAAHFSARRGTTVVRPALGRQLKNLGDNSKAGPFARPIDWVCN
jgi:hypothetical protein